LPEWRKTFDASLVHLARSRLLEPSKLPFEELQQFNWELECWMTSRGVALDLTDIGLKGVVHTILSDVSSLSMLHQTLPKGCTRVSNDEENLPLWQILEDVEQQATLHGIQRNRSEIVSVFADWYTNRAKELAQKAWHLSYGNEVAPVGWSSDEITVWTSMRDLLMVPTVKSASTFELKSCDRILREMTQTDRLPHQNSKEALQTMCNLWNTVDTCRFEATRHKRLSKFCYIGILVLMFMSCVVSALAATGDFQNWFGAGAPKICIVVLSLMVLMSMGTMRYVNPVPKWHCLRTAELTMESEAWLFRTRCGKYSNASRQKGLGARASCGGRGSRHSAEHILSDMLKKERASVLERAALKDTAFLKIRDEHIYRHGQLQPKTFGWTRMEKFSMFITVHQKSLATLCYLLLVLWLACAALFMLTGMLNIGTYMVLLVLGIATVTCMILVMCFRYTPVPPDNHHSIVRPQDYIKLRLYPAIDFYQGRLPGYHFMQTTFRMLMLLGSVLGFMMATAKVINYASILAISLALVTAFEEFTGVSKKLNRHSTIVGSLQDLLAWWTSLDEGERERTDHAEHLVLVTEALVAGDRDGCLSAAMAGKNAQKELSMVDAKEKEA